MPGYSKEKATTPTLPSRLQLLGSQSLGLDFTAAAAYTGLYIGNIIVGYASWMRVFRRLTQKLCCCCADQSKYQEQFDKPEKLTILPHVFSISIAKLTWHRVYLTILFLIMLFFQSLQNVTSFNMRQYYLDFGIAWYDEIAYVDC